MYPAQSSLGKEKIARDGATNVDGTLVLITVHPQMLDIMSMSQFLLMLGNILKRVEAVGVNVSLEWFRHLVTRFRPMDIPQQQVIGFMQSMFAAQMMRNQMVKSTAISNAGLTKQSLYEVERLPLAPTTYGRASEPIDALNASNRTLEQGVGT